MSDLALLLQATDFAARKHEKQRRKNGDIPYVNHPIGVARNLFEIGGVRDAEVLAAGLLHDTLEDTDTTFEELTREFGSKVASIVREVTDDKSLPKVQRKQRQVEHAGQISEPAQLVKLADKLYNLRDLGTRPPPDWDAARIQGYFCWGHAVVQAIGTKNQGLYAALQQVFAKQLHVGGSSFRAVPEAPAERERILQQYYRQMSRLDD